VGFLQIPHRFFNILVLIKSVKYYGTEGVNSTHKLDEYMFINMNTKYMYSAFDNLH
jgi:hypothetical protein